MLNKLLDRFNVASTARSKYESNYDGWEKWYSNYMSIPPKDVPRFRNNIFIPKTREVIETWIPVVYGSPPRLSISRVRSGDINKAFNARDLIQYYLKIGETRLLFEQFLRYAAIYGTAIAKPYWNYRENAAVERITKQIPETGEMTIVQYENIRAVVDSPSFKIIDLLNFWIDPTATSMDDAEWCVERRFISADSFKKMVDAKIIKMPKNIDWKSYVTTNPTTATSSDEVGSNYNFKDVVELYEYWDNDGTVSIVLGNEKLISTEKFIYDKHTMPYIAYRVAPVPNQFYGLGMAQPISSLQETINSMQSRRMDNIDLSVNTMFRVTPGSPPALLDWVAKPGERIEANPGEIEQLRVNDVTGSFVPEMGMAGDMIKRLSGVVEYVQGSTVPGMTKTATGVAAMQNAAFARIRQDALRLNVEFIQNLAEWYHSLAKQFMTEDFPIAVHGDGLETYVSIKPADIECEIDFEVADASTSPLNSSMRVDALTTALNLVSMPNIVQSAAQQGLAPNITFFVKNILDAMRINGAHKAFRPLTDDELAQMNAQRAQTDAATQGAMNEMAGRMGAAPGQQNGNPVPQTQQTPTV